MKKLIINLLFLLCCTVIAQGQITIIQSEVVTRYSQVKEFLKNSRCENNEPYNQDEIIELFIEIETYVEQEQYDFALIQTNEMITKSSSDRDNLREGYFWQGYIHLIDTNNVEAISNFEKAEALICKEKADNYNNLLIIQCLGYSLYNEQRYAEAYQKLQKVDIRNNMNRVKAIRAGEGYQSILFDDFESVLQECKEKMKD
jgi:tetratricopeptide (TPR) repeat protein